MNIYAIQLPNGTIYGVDRQPDGTEGGPLVFENRNDAAQRADFMAGTIITRDLDTILKTGHHNLYLRLANGQTRAYIRKDLTR